MWSVDLHFAVESVVQEKVVSHAHTMRLHWVTLAIVVIADVT
jgi:hypothetical protein